MATLSTFTLRDKYVKSTLEKTLRAALIAEAICKVDTSDARRLQSPYGSASAATMQNLAGTYTPSTSWSTTDDTLTVDKEIIVSEHIFAHEDITNNFDIFAARADEMAFAAARVIDVFTLNALTDDGTGAYTTPVGGFTTAGNITTIMGSLIGAVSGYDDMGKGFFLVLENTDVTGVIQAQTGLGYSYADQALNNGFLTNMLGVDIYVTRTGTFQSATVGGRVFANNNHRVFGVKGVATFARPRGTSYTEKEVGSKTGKELLVHSLYGFKLWAPKTALVVDITLA